MASKFNKRLSGVSVEFVAGFKNTGTNLILFTAAKARLTTLHSIKIISGKLNPNIKLTAQITTPSGAVFVTLLEYLDITPTSFFHYELKPIFPIEIPEEHSLEITYNATDAIFIFTEITEF